MPITAILGAVTMAVRSIAGIQDGIERGKVEKREFLDKTFQSMQQVHDGYINAVSALIAEMGDEGKPLDALRAAIDQKRGEIDRIKTDVQALIDTLKTSTYVKEPADRNNPKTVQEAAYVFADLSARYFHLAFAKPAPTAKATALTTLQSLVQLADDDTLSREGCRQGAKALKEELRQRWRLISAAYAKLDAISRGL